MVGHKFEANLIHIASSKTASTTFQEKKKLLAMCEQPGSLFQEVFSVCWKLYRILHLPASATTCLRATSSLDLQ